LHRFTYLEKAASSQAVVLLSADDHLSADIEAGLREFVESLEEDLDLLEPSGDLMRTSGGEGASLSEGGQEEKCVEAQECKKAQEPEAASTDDMAYGAQEASAIKEAPEDEEATVGTDALAVTELASTVLAPPSGPVLPFALSATGTSQQTIKKPSRGGIARLQVRLPGGYHYDVLLEKPEGASLSIGWLPNESEADPDLDANPTQPVKEPQFG